VFIAEDTKWVGLNRSGGNTKMNGGCMTLPKTTKIMLSNFTNDLGEGQNNIDIADFYALAMKTVLIFHI
jgi:hypothetical protein